MDVFALAGWSSASSGPLFPKMHLCLLRGTEYLPVLKSRWQSTDLFLFEPSSWSPTELNESQIVPRCTQRAGRGEGPFSHPPRHYCVAGSRRVPNQTPELSGAEPSLVRWDVLSFWPICSRTGLVGPEPPCPAAPRPAHPSLPQLDSAPSHPCQLPPGRRGSYFTTFDSKSFVPIGVLSQMFRSHRGGRNCRYQR